jgi:hypothetical protein
MLSTNQVLKIPLATSDNTIAVFTVEQSEASARRVSAELRHIAKGYQVRAATMDHGRVPDIEEEPPLSAGRHLWSQSADRVGAPALKNNIGNPVNCFTLDFRRAARVTLLR